MPDGGFAPEHGHVYLVTGAADEPLRAGERVIFDRHWSNLYDGWEVYVFQRAPEDQQAADRALDIMTEETRVDFRPGVRPSWPDLLRPVDAEPNERLRPQPPRSRPARPRLP